MMYKLLIDLLHTFGNLRKLAVITLLMIYSGSQFGPVLVSFCRPLIHAISTMRQQRRMRQEETVTRTITMSTRNYLACLKEDDEIMIDGRLHDIVEVKISEGFVHLKVLEDEKEGRWMDGLNAFTNTLHKHKRSQRSTQQVLSWLFNICSIEKEIDFKFEPGTLQRLTFASISYPICSLALNSPGQPPESIS